uniref:uncharacterized protein n=1 Tax=Myxine glutinosa TaxID=7769 RepID=UPI00358E3E89
MTVPSLPRKKRCEMAGEPKMQAWQPEEITELLAIWTEKNIQDELESSIRNERVYSQISSLLLQKGVRRSAKQCREKIKKMKQEYKKLKEHNNKSGVVPRKNKYYDVLDSVLDNRPTIIGNQVMNSAYLPDDEAMNEGTEDIESPVDVTTMVFDSGDSQDAGPSNGGVHGESPASPSSIPSWDVIKYRVNQKKKRSSALMEFTRALREMQERQLEWDAREMEINREERQRREEERKAREEENREEQRRREEENREERRRREEEERMHEREERRLDREERRLERENFYAMNAQLVSAINNVASALISNSQH